MLNVKEEPPASISFSRSRITRREAMSFLVGGALTATMAFFFLSLPKPPASVGDEVTTTTTQQRSITIEQVATTTTQQQSTTAGGGGSKPSYMISKILATATIDTESIS